VLAERFQISLQHDQPLVKVLMIFAETHVWQTDACYTTHSS